MKLKKLLASILCVAMVLSTMGITTFAEGEVGTISVSTAEDLAAALTKNEANIAVILEGNIDLPITSLGSITAGSGEYKLGGENTQEITIDLNQKTLNVATTYWSALGSVNPDATITVKNGTMVSRGNSATTWNANDLRFCNCNWVFEDVTFNKEVALDNAGKSTTMNNVTINGTGDYYALWITAEGQTVNIDGLVINTVGRGIKIDEQYVDAEKVALAVSNSTFKTAKKAAIVVKSVAGANIVASNNNIENVNADTTNLVCVDSDLPASYPKVKVTIDGEPVAPYLEDAGTGVACIGNSYYMTLTNALDAAQNGDVVDLLGGTIVLKDTRVTTVPINKNITITNGTFDITDFVAEHSNSIFDIYGGAKVTFEDVDFTGSNYSSSYGVIYAHETSKVTLNNCDFNLKNEIDAINGAVLKGNDYANDKFEVNNCNFTLKNTSRVFTIMTIDMNGGSIKATHEPISEEHAFRDVYGTIDDATISFDNFQNGIKNTKNAALTFTNSTVSSTNMAEYDLQLAGGATVSGVAFDKTNCEATVYTAAIGTTYYATLQSALDAANVGDIIVLECDVSEKIVIAAPAVAALAANDDAIVIDLAGKTLNGYILIQDANKNIEIKNGNIINEDSTESAIESVGTLTVTDVNITSARHAINVEGGNAEINGGNFALIQKDVLTQNVIGAENAVVIINDGVFTGPAGTTADSGAAVAAKTGSKVTINGGKFSGGKNNTIAGKGTLVVNGGMFDQDVTAYIAETSEAIDRGAYEYPYGVAPKAAGKINVALKATDNKNVYNIVITSADEYDINEFVSAELTFKNESTTVGGSVMDYKINGYADNKTFAQEAKDAVGLKDNEEQYIISLNDGAKRLSSTDAKDGDGIIIGQVEFFGQGDIKFSVTKGEVDTTWQNTNLGRYYTTEVVAPATEATLGIENASINSNVPEVHRDVAVNVAFNHNIDTEKYWGNYQITATIKNSAMNYTEPKDITIKDIKSGACVFEDVPVGYITVTLKAPGFRTYTYNTTLEETKDNGVLVLNFWNDVKKGNDEAIEKGKDKMAHNFLVGDIVMDMKVDKYDLAAVTSYYGTYGIDKAEAEKYIKYDLNRDGDIDIRDVQYVLHTMGN